MKSLFYLFASLTLFTILLFSCRDDIEFKTPDSIQDAIFIEGKLTKGDPSLVQVTIGQVFDFSTHPGLFLADFVEIIDEEGNSLPLNTKRQGIFTLSIPSDHPTFKVDYGHAYKLRLQLRNEAIYESTYDTLYPVPIMTDLKKDKVTKVVRFADGKIVTEEFATFNVSTPLDVEHATRRAHLLWELESVFQLSDTPESSAGRPPCVRTSAEPKTCYVSINPVENYRTINTKLLSGDKLTDFTVFEAKNTNTFVFAEGYYLTVIQESLSDEAFRYWEQANLLTNRDGSIFEQPSGKIITNFRNVDNPRDEVYGFFFATESNLKRIYVAPEFAGNPRPVCPDLIPIPPNPICSNCLCQANSTTEKPEWWVE